MDNFSWKDALHYGGALALYAIGIAGMSGVHVPGITIDPGTCIGTATGILAGGFKGGVTSGDKK